MKYQRKSAVFTLKSILDQMVEYIKETGRLPVEIYLPPEEFLGINYLFNDLERRVEFFLGVPLKLTLTDQDIPFKGF